MSKESDETKVAITFNGRTIETTGKHIRLFAKMLKRKNAGRFKHQKEK